MEVHLHTNVVFYVQLNTNVSIQFISSKLTATFAGIAPGSAVG